MGKIFYPSFISCKYICFMLLLFKVINLARRFIVNDNDIKEINENEIIIYGDEVKHIQVLRFNVSDEININNKIYKILEMKRDSIKLSFEKEAKVIGVPNVNLKLYIATLKGENCIEDFVKFIEESDI